MSRRLRPHVRARTIAALFAVLLAGLQATNAIALTWTSDTKITAFGKGYAYPGSLAVSSTTTAHMVYEHAVQDVFGVYYRRTTNSGSTWGTPIILSRPSSGVAGLPVIDANGAAVDAAWVEGDALLASSDSVVRYRRSTDSGGTWLAPFNISPSNESAGMPRVGHKSSSATVGVVWTNTANGKVYVKISTDNGATWKTRINLSTTSNKPYGGTILEAFPVIAFGSGVIYVGYYSANKTLKLRRSTDNGVTWKASQSIATNAASWWSPSIAATSSTAVFGYGAQSTTDNWTVYRRTTDKGATWASVKSLSASSGDPAFQPVLQYRSGSFRAIYERCNSTCSTSNVYYKTSTTGTTWTTAISAGVKNRPFEAPADVDVATNVLVLYVDYASNSGNDVKIRRGS